MATDEPFFLVEVMPSFRGGDINRFREWVQKRTNYPQEALNKKIQGRIFLTFIIEPDGSVSNVNIVKGVDPLIDNEAVKAIEGSPKWSPGLQRGQPVRVRYSLWLSFVI
jgi:protein TonB